MGKRPRPGHEPWHRNKLRQLRISGAAPHVPTSYDVEVSRKSLVFGLALGRAPCSALALPVRRHSPCSPAYFSSVNVSFTGLWSLVANPVSTFSARARTLSETTKPSTVVVYVTPFW